MVGGGGVRTHASNIKDVMVDWLGYPRLNLHLGSVWEAGRGNSASPGQQFKRQWGPSLGPLWVKAGAVRPR